MWDLENKFDINPQNKKDVTIFLKVRNDFFFNDFKILNNTLNF